jgi:ABC-type molybdate transport system substrate-binding protein
MHRMIPMPSPSVGWLATPAAVLGLALADLVFLAGREARPAELTVMAAGATESTLRDVVGIFEKESGHTVKLAYGAVGALRDTIYAPGSCSRAPRIRTPRRHSSAS